MLIAQKKFTTENLPLTENTIFSISVVRNQVFFATLDPSLQFSLLYCCFIISICGKTKYGAPCSILSTLHFKTHCFRFLPSAVLFVCLFVCCYHPPPCPTYFCAFQSDSTRAIQPFYICSCLAKQAFSVRVTDLLGLQH